jgi:hypothetical protein
VCKENYTSMDSAASCTLQFKGAAAVAVFCIAVVLSGHFCYTVNGGGAMAQENTVATWIYVVHPGVCAGVMTAELQPFHILLEHPPCR